MAKDNVQSKILDAIRRDDVRAFGELTEQKVNRALKFGRFPILSLVYIYKARKIAGYCLSRFAKLQEYTLSDEGEPSDAYQIFKDNAGVYLRLFPSDGVVTPAETLAVLNQAEYLVKNFETLKPAEEQQENIIKILTAKRGCAEIKGNLLIIPKQRLSRKHTFVLTAMAGALAFFIALFSVFTGLIPVRIGFGSEESPRRITTVGQLQDAAGRDGYFVLAADITLPYGHIIEEFSATLYGAGHTITSPYGALFAKTTAGQISGLNFASPLGTPFSAENRGNITNVSFFAGGEGMPALMHLDHTTGVTPGSQGEAGGFGFFTHINTGDLINITADINAAIISSFPERAAGAPVFEAFIGAIAGQNRGTVRDGFAAGQINFTGDARADVYLGGLAGINLGQIIDGGTDEDLTFTAMNGNIGGIVGFNGGTGLIAGAVARAVLNANTDSDYWTPVLGGIAALNSGTIRWARSLGRLSAFRSSAGGGFVINGGIIGIDYGGRIENNLSSAWLWSNQPALTVEEGAPNGAALGGVIGTSLAAVVEPELAAELGAEYLLYADLFNGIEDNAYSAEFAPAGIALLFVASMFVRTATGFALMGLGGYAYFMTGAGAYTEEMIRRT